MQIGLACHLPPTGGIVVDNWKMSQKNVLLERYVMKDTVLVLLRVIFLPAFSWGELLGNVNHPVSKCKAQDDVSFLVRMILILMAVGLFPTLP